MKKQYLAYLLVVTTGLSGCSSGTIFKQSKLGDINVLSVDARQRLVLEGKVGGKRIVCTEPSPDAIVAQAAEFAASGSSPLAGQVVNAKLAASSSETAASIGVRTETIQLLRDGYFRICEARLNGQIEEKEYVATLRFIDEFILTVVAIEALGGRVAAPAVLISANGKAIVSDQSVTAESTPGTSAANAIQVNTEGLSHELASQIAAILKEYYARKKQYLMHHY